MIPRKMSYGSPDGFSVLTEVSAIIIRMEPLQKADLKKSTVNLIILMITAV